MSLLKSNPHFQPPHLRPTERDAHHSPEGPLTPSGGEGAGEKLNQNKKDIYMADYISYWARHVTGEYIQGWDRVERSSEIRKNPPRFHYSRVPTSRPHWDMLAARGGGSRGIWK